MTDGNRFSIISSAKEKIERMGLDCNVQINGYIKIRSENFTVIFKKDVPFYSVVQKKNQGNMDQLKWEDFSTEVENIGHAVFLINATLREAVFNV